MRANSCCRAAAPDGSARRTARSARFALLIVLLWAGTSMAGDGGGGLAGGREPAPGISGIGSRSERVLTALTQKACETTRAKQLARGLPTTSGKPAGPTFASMFPADDPRCDALAPLALQTPWNSGLIIPATSAPDGTLLGRRLLSTIGGVAMELMAYASGGLTVGGLLCYPADGARHSAVIHVPGGLEGIFAAGTGANMVQTCIDWAANHGRAAFAPSLRGNDGSEGTRELCQGEATDVASAALLIRSLEMIDPSRIGLVGGSIGGCVALRASALIPDLRAVVAYVPPTDWKSLVQYHRTSWAPATESTCEGGTREWNIGGPQLADVFDGLICGRIGCTDAEYESRSPIPALLSQTAPTLIVSAGADNVVPVGQQLLWSILRQGTGHPVTLYSVDPCDPPGTPAPQLDVHIYARNAYHLLAGSPISSGLLFLMARLDDVSP